MDLRRFFFEAAAILSAVSVMSCKKETDDVDLMMDGYPEVNIDDYVEVNSTFELTGTGITRPEEVDGYFWKVYPGIQELNDTTDVFRFSFGKDIGDYRIVCTAFKEGYYDRPTTKWVTVVDPAFDKSLKIGEVSGVQEFVDERDGKVYRYRNVNGTDWFVTNLAYEDKGFSYKNFDVMWDIYGGYYSHADATEGNICPEGWTLPSEEDWKALVSSTGKASVMSVDGGEIYENVASALMSKATFNDEQMWQYSPESDPTNETGLSAVPSGFFSQNAFSGVGQYACFWSSDTYDGKGVYHYLYYDDSSLRISYADRNYFAASVRCIRKQ